MKQNNSLLLALSVAVLLLVFPACNKLSKATYSPSTTDSVVIKSNVIVVDTTVYSLASTPDQLNSGVYVYNYGPSLPAMRHNGDFAPGMIIIGITGEGYLRKVVSVAASSEYITVNTQQARLEDVFEEGSFNFVTGFSEWNEQGGNFISNYQYIELSKDVNARIAISNGAISLNPSWNYSLQFHGGKLTNFSAYSGTSNLTASTQINITGANATAFNVTDTINKVTTTHFVWVGNIPVLVTTDLFIVANVAGTTSGVLNNSLTISNSSTMQSNTIYNGSAWQNSYTITPTSSIGGSIVQGGMNNQATFSIIPVMNTRFYGVTGASATYALSTEMTGRHSATTNDWDFAAQYSLQAALNEYSAILGYSLGDFSYTKNADSAVYSTPGNVIKYSGDNQHGTSGQYLPQPITVKVTDNKGKGQPGVEVYFEVTSGGGSLSYYSTMTDTNGFAQAFWELGAFAAGYQTMTATVRNGIGNPAGGSPVTFTAN